MSQCVLAVCPELTPCFNYFQNKRAVLTEVFTTGDSGNTIVAVVHRGAKINKDDEFLVGALKLNATSATS